MKLEGDVVRLAGPPVLEVVMRRTLRARRLSLRVSGLDGRATLSLPYWISDADALNFLREKEGWLRTALGRLPARQMVAPGGEVMLGGRRLEVCEGPVRAIRVEESALIVPPDPKGARTAARVEAFLKASARTALLPAVARHSERLGRRATAISLRDTRSRWGSCTAEGRLMFSWRLIMAPPAVLNYVAAHEVAHLAHMDHSRAFWSCVKGLMPDYATHRHWLRAHGAELHGYVFRQCGETGGR